MNILSDPFYLVPPLLTAAVSIALILLVWRGSLRNRSLWVFLAMLAAVALWAVLTYKMRSSADIYEAVLWEKPLVTLGYLVYLLYYHLSIYYSRIKGQRLLLAAAYAVLIILIILSPTDLLIKGMRSEYYGYAPILSPMTYILFIAPIFFLTMGVINFIRRYNVVRSSDERNRILYLTIAALFPFAGALLDALTNLPPASTWANLLFCVVCSIAVMRYHLLDFQLVVRKSLAFILLSMAVATPYLIILTLINYLVDPSSREWWWQIILLLAMAIILQPLYSLIQRTVDRLFYRGRYDFLKSLYHFSQESHEVGNLSMTGSSLVNLTKQALNASGAHLLLGSEGEQFKLVSSTDGYTGLSLDTASTLIHWLSSQGEVLYQKEIEVRPQLQSLTQNELNLLKKTSAELLVPLKSQDGQLVGVLIVGKKLSERPYSDDDERIITVVANRMAVELENARLYEEETRIRQELQEQERLKNEFLHNVAHELKTPLTAIMASSDLLNVEEMGKIDPETMRRLIDNLKHSSEAMSIRINELLDLARMQVTGITIKASSVDIVSLVQEVVSDATILFQRKQQKLELKIAPGLPSVMGDRDRIIQILTNILSNANKFSPFDSLIRVVLEQKEDKVRVEILDSAPLLSDMERSKVFNPYYRGENSSQRERIPGLGLGLYICKKLVELHHGEIGCYNNGTEGNVFWFALPVYKQSPERIESRPSIPPQSPDPSTPDLE